MQDQCDHRNFRIEDMDLVDDVSWEDYDEIMAVATCPDCGLRAPIDGHVTWDDPRWEDAD